MNRRFLCIAGMSVVGATLGVGCVDASPDPSAAGEGSLASESASAPDASAPDAAAAEAACVEGRYIAVLENEACAAVPGANGTWTPSPLFENAPPAFHACVYAWSSASGATADVPALKAYVQPRAGGSALTPSCSLTGGKVQVGAMATPIPDLASPDPGGTVGCDVCGYVDDGTVFVVLPPEQVVLGAFAVPISNGSSKTFKVDVTSGKKAATVDLPPLPPGLTYVEGPILVR